MNDRYFYRAKRKNNGEWVEGFYLFCPIQDNNKSAVENFAYKHWIVTHNGKAYEVDPSTICQCSGLKDKNGMLIWEKDIVQYRDCTIENYVIAWETNKACFEYQQYGCSIMDFEELSGIEVEVIGNIFDNAELLEVGE